MYVNDKEHETREEKRSGGTVHESVGHKSNEKTKASTELKSDSRNCKTVVKNNGNKSVNGSPTLTVSEDNTDEMIRFKSKGACKDDLRVDAYGEAEIDEPGACRTGVCKENESICSHESMGGIESEKHNGSMEAQRCVKDNVKEVDVKECTFKQDETTQDCVKQNKNEIDSKTKPDDVSDSPAILPVTLTTYSCSRSIKRLSGRSVSLNFDSSFTGSLPTVSADAKANIYYHFCSKKRHLSVDSASALENNTSNKIVNPFPVQHQNLNRIRAGMRLGLYMDKRP